jgi:hypothetical protein
VDDPQSNRNKFSTKALRIIYCCLLFPLIIGFLIINLLNIVINNQLRVMFFADIPVSLNSTLSLILICISSLFYFSKPTYSSSKKAVIRIFRVCLSATVGTFLYILTTVTVVSYHKNFAYSIEIIATIVFTFFIYLVIKRPYKSHLHNAGQIMNVLMVLYFVGWMIATEYFTEITT